MNHSCDPNVVAVDEEDIPTGYTQVAIKDIKKGDEITADYSFFDYECNGHRIDPCLCKGPKCRGVIGGMRELPLKEQARLLFQCDRWILGHFLKDRPDVIYINDDFEGIDIELDSNDNVQIIPKASFKRGDTILKFKIIEYHKGQNFLIKTKTKNHFIENYNGKDNSTTTNKFCYPLELMKISSVPNITIVMLEDGEEFKVIAHQDIAIDEELRI